MFFSIFLALLTLNVYFAMSLDGSSTCYWPDGAEATGLSPCTGFSSGGYAPCCWDDDICTSDGYCITTKYRHFYRGACTKKDWGTEPANACPGECMERTTFLNTSVSVLPCNYTTLCCDYAPQAASCCENGPTFKINSGVLKFEYPAAVSSKSSDVFAAAATTSGTGSNNTSSSDPDTCSKSSSTVQIALGVGLGIPLAISVAALIFTVILIKRRSPKAPNSTTQELLDTSYKYSDDIKNPPIELAASRINELPG